MLAVPLKLRVRRTLAVAVAPDLSLSLDDAAGAYFPAGLQAPQADNGQLDGSPRTSLAPWRLYWSRTPAELHACDRIEVPGDTTYELIAQPREVSSGRRVVGRSCPVLPVDVLYPREAELKDLGIDAAIAAVRCVIYSEREEQGQRSSYVNTFAEFPPSVWPHLDGAANRELHFADGSVWRIAEATLAPEMPYVTASAKKVA
jgi:hypothetical protein